jgi:hypothetical protein
MNAKNQAIEIMDDRVVEILRKARRSLMASPRFTNDINVVVALA